MTMKLQTDRFPALGTEVTIGLVADEARAAAVLKVIRQMIAAFEARFSRFREDSELSQVNAAGGRPTRVSHEMVELWQAAQRAYEWSEQIVDPTIAMVLRQVGYHANFDDLPFEQTAENAPPLPPLSGHARPAFSEVQLNPAAQTLTLPPGVQLDFGGIGKGFLADRLAARLRAVTTNYWLSLGGDMVVSGTDQAGRPWPIGVQDPEQLDADVASLRLPSGTFGVATSGTTKRRGVRYGVPWHHLIDPRTGRPAESDALAVTVVASTSLRADVLAKTVLILGSQAGLAFLGRHSDAAALIIGSHRRLVSSPTMRPYLQEPCVV